MDIKWTSTVFRALRKYHGLLQGEYAKELGISQGYVSKVEKEKMSPDLEVWIRLSEKFNLHPMTAITGKIEFFNQNEIQISQSCPGSFQLSQAYSANMGSTVREIYPILKFLRLKLGNQAYKELLTSLKSDPDYFYIMANPINLQFTNDLYSIVLQNKTLSPNKLIELEKLCPFKENYSRICSGLPIVENRKQALKFFFSHQENFYQKNTFHIIKEEKLIRFEDDEFVKDFKLSKEFNHYRRSYSLLEVNTLLNEIKRPLPGYVLGSFKKHEWELVLSA